MTDCCFCETVLENSPTATLSVLNAAFNPIGPQATPSNGVALKATVSLFFSLSAIQKSMWTTIDITTSDSVNVAGKAAAFSTFSWVWFARIVRGHIPVLVPIIGRNGSTRDMIK
jgi:hypothetical protein